MSDMESLASPVPPVNADDLKRVWYAMRDIAAMDHVPGRTEGFSTQLLEPYCESGADVTAVSVRALMLRVFLHVGLLDEFREGNELRDIVFRVAAVFPMEQGVERLNFPDFIKRLRS